MDHPLPVSTTTQPSPSSTMPTDLFTPFDQTAIEQTIIDRFEQMAQKYGQRVAVTAGGQQLTYGALNRLANRLAHAILADDEAEPLPVALLLDHDAPIIVTLCGVLKAGRAYVALDPGYPRARLNHILADLQPALIVTNDKNLAAARSLAGETSLLNLDQLDPTLPDDNPDLTLSAETLAAILYTSGSTGRPKGVQRNHRHILHRVWLETNDYHITAADNISLLYACSFGASVADIFITLLNGATLCLYDVKTEGLTRLTDWLINEEITFFHLPADLMRQYLDILSADVTFPQMRQITPSGRLYKRDVERLWAHLPDDAQIIQRLASTETSMVTRLIIDRDTVIDSDIVPVGYPLPGKEVILIDEQGQPVGVNDIGEIMIKSRYLSPGYWRRPDLTETKFRSANGNGERLYRMGDLGRFRPDGRLEFLGRVDFQVKIRGYRIDLNEVEAALYNLTEVKTVVVTAPDAPTGDKQLVAYVVPTASSVIVADLRAALAAKLPVYMLPTHFMLLNQLPLTANGKIDRRALPPLDRFALAPTRPYVPPRTPLEESLTQLWAEVLGLKRVGIEDNFFELGGHSISALRLLAQVETLIGQKLALTDLLQAPSVTQLIAHLRHEAPASTTALIPLRTSGSKPPFFCIPGNLGNVYVDLGHLKRYLGPEQPLYGLQDSADNPARIEALAARYVAEIRTVQPHGPYHLGGICSGGIIAFEMARQLRARGEQIALLAMIESPPPHKPGLGAYLNFSRVLVGRWLRRLFRRADQVSHLQIGDQKSYLRLKKKLIANSWALRRYRPRPFDGPLHLFLTEETLQRADHPRLKWRELASPALEVHRIPGNHDSITGGDGGIIEPLYMEALAEALTRAIDRKLTE